MKNRTYAMDTHFIQQAREYPLAEQCRLVKECGYDDYYVTTVNLDSGKTAAYRNASRRVGLGLSGAYVCVDITQAPKGEALAKTLGVMRELNPPSELELALTRGSEHQEASSPAHDADAIRWIEALLPTAMERGVNMALYPHVGFWLEKFGDGLRLAEAVNQSPLGVVFCGYHWFRADNSALGPLIERAGSHLRRVNLCGSIRMPEDTAGLNPTVEPLDCGELDNGAIMHKLKDVGYRGPIGVQGYAVTTDAGNALRRSANQLRTWMA